MSEREKSDDRNLVSPNSGLPKDRRKPFTLNHDVIPAYKEGTVRVAISPGPNKKKLSKRHGWKRLTLDKLGILKVQYFISFMAEELIKP